MRPAATVCVSTYNRAPQLSRLLEALAAQDLPDLEVVVYNDASTDGTTAVLDRWAPRLPLTALHGGRNLGPAAGRNRAWQAASGSLVLFTDDDCVPSASWARSHLEAAADRRVTVGRTVPDPAQKHHEGPFSRSLLVEDASLFHTCNVGYPLGLLEELNGFDERYRRAGGEDTDLGLRAMATGAEPQFVAGALVLHDVRPSSWLAAMRETSKWADVPLFAAAHPASSTTALWSDHWWRRSHPPAALAAAGAVAAFFLPTPWRVFALAAAGPWLRLRTGELRPEARRRDWSWVLPAQLAVDLAEVAVLARGSWRHRRLLL